MNEFDRRPIVISSLLLTLCRYHAPAERNADNFYFELLILGRVKMITERCYHLILFSCHLCLA